MGKCSKCGRPLQGHGKPIGKDCTLMPLLEKENATEQVDSDHVVTDSENAEGEGVASENNGARPRDVMSTPDDINKVTESSNDLTAVLKHLTSEMGRLAFAVESVLVKLDRPLTDPQPNIQHCSHSSAMPVCDHF